MASPQDHIPSAPYVCGFIWLLHFLFYQKHLFFSDVDGMYWLPQEKHSCIPPSLLTQDSFGASGHHGSRFFSNTK